MLSGPRQLKGGIESQEMVGGARLMCKRHMDARRETVSPEQVWDQFKVHSIHSKHKTGNGIKLS